MSIVTLALWALLASSRRPFRGQNRKAATVSRATVGTALSAAFSAAACAAVLLLLPPRVASSSAPFADLATAAWGTASGWAVSCSRRQRPRRPERLDPAAGELPGRWRRRLFARLRPHLAQRRPAAARSQRTIWSPPLVLLTVSRTLVGIFTFFALLATTATLAAYLACALALLRGRAAGRTARPSWRARHCRLPGRAYPLARSSVQAARPCSGAPSSCWRLPIHWWLQTRGPSARRCRPRYRVRESAARALRGRQHPPATRQQAPTLPGRRRRDFRPGPGWRR